MKSLPKITPCILVFLLVFLIAACGGPADEHGPTDEPGAVTEASTETGPVDEDNAHALSPCGVTEAMVGQELAVAGNVELIDGGDPNGLFVGLTERGCMLGAFIDATVFDQWSENRQAAIGEGNQITLSGRLTSFDGELVLEVIAPETSSEEPIRSGETSQTNAQFDLMSVEIEDSVLLDVPIVYSGYEGHTGLCYLGSFAMAAIYHHPELSFADIVA